MRIGYAIYSANGVIRLVSRSLELKLGYSPDEINGLPIVDLLAEGNLKNLNLFLCSGSVWGNLLGREKNLGPVEVAIECLGSDCFANQDSPYYLASIQNVGAEHPERFSDKLRWGEYVDSWLPWSSVSINLRTILDGISGDASELLAKLETDKSRSVCFQVLREAIFGELSGDGRLNGDPSEVDLSKCLVQAVDRYRQYHDGVRIELGEDMDGQAPSPINLPATDLVRLVLAMVSNVHYIARKEAITLQFCHFEDSLDLALRFRVSDSPERSGASDLVSSVCRLAWEGAFSCSTSAEGEREWRFRIRTTPSGFGQGLPAVKSSAKGKRILVVEDNKLNAEILCYFLKDRGYRYEVVENGLRAVQMYCDGKYDLILMDIMLPEMSGYEATEKILEKADSEMAPPIVGVTAKVFRDDYERCFEVGMSDVVHKPIDFDVLSATLDRNLSRAGRSSSESRKPIQSAQGSEEPIESGGVFDREVARVFIKRMISRESDRSKVIDRVIREFEQGIERIEESVAQGDREAIERNAHSLKGSLGLVGSKDALDLARGLELTAASGGAKFNPNHWLALIRQAFVPLKASLEELKSD